MIYCLKHREDLALFVSDLLATFDLDFASITITKAEPSEGYYARCAIDTSSEDTVKNWVQTYYGLPLIT